MCGGVLAASVCFTLPSALHGLKLAAVAVVAQAVWTMGQRLCPDRARLSLCVASAAALLVVLGALAQLGVLALGSATGWWLYRDTVPIGEMASESRSHALAATDPFRRPLTCRRWPRRRARASFVARS